MRFPVDADPRFGAFTLRTDCPRCGAHLPANGPVAEIDCADCGARVKVPAGLLRDLADQLEERWPRVEAGDTVTLGDLTWRWTAAASPGPTCAGCAAPLQDPDPDAALLPCGACGATTPAFAAPDVLRGSVPSARRVFGADAEGTRPTDTLAPVAMACPQCGAGLSITTAWQRLSPCSFCGVTVHLPDAVWRQLHPPRTVRPWTVRFDGESRPAARARIGAERGAAERRQKEAKAEAERRGRQQEAERREKESAKKREIHEQAARAKAANERRWHLETLPLVVVAWGGIPFVIGAVLAATAWYILGTPTILLGRVDPAILAVAPRIVVVAAGLLALAGWTLAFWATAVRSRQSFWNLLPLGLFQLGISSLPMVGWFFGLFFAYAHLRGTEPTLPPGPKTIPRIVRGPLATYLLVFAAYSYVMISAVVNTPLATMWANFLANN